MAGMKQQWRAWLVYYMCTRLVAGDLEHVCVHGQNVNNGLCGEQLAGILKLLCGAEGYNGFGKRSALMPQADTALLDIENVDGHKIFLPKEEALSYFEKRTVAKWDISGPGYQGIVCECCYNRCDIMELKQYCAQPKLYGGGKRTRPERARRRRYRARTAQQHSLRRRYEMQRDAGEKLEQPNSITLGGGVEQRAEEIRNKMVGVPVEVPVEISVEVPEEAPIKTRVQVPIEAPVEVPVEAPLEVVAVPMEAPEKDMNHHAMVEERPVITGIRLESKPRITRNKLYGAVTRKLSQQTTVDSKHKPSHMIIAVGDWRDDV